MESKMNPQDAQVALAAVEQSRSDIADRLVTPWWYHPILGLLVGGLGAVAGSGARLAVVWGAIAAFGVGVYLLATAYRRLTGVWADGMSGGPRARRSVTVAGIVGVAIMGGGAITGLGLELWWPSTVAGAVIAVLTVVWGRHFDEVLRSELRESA
ncbi:hypothetical protein [Glycomyces paridis]|uniref:Uncharacterized protein n=1 Tax=Glycomyces paridis TaxID=2126555 RepID=A0A4S8PEU9_9ACTN|nr:hypothetical protein [Glycomyces paridis]THV28958.1 hypothetical protein E9998_09370 [Glycomyces paridis]